MSASEKAAWFQLAVCLAALTVVALLFPWLGQRATAGFAVLALLAVSVVFYRRRGNRVAVDERDREIERRATNVAVSATWVGLLAILAVAGTWASYTDTHSVSNRFLNWLIWGQLTAFFAIKQIATIVMYRSQFHAA